MKLFYQIRFKLISRRLVRLTIQLFNKRYDLFTHALENLKKQYE